MAGQASNLNLIIIEQAMTAGATLAGLTSRNALKNSPGYLGGKQFPCPDEAAAILVIALAHQEHEPELDWWVGNPFGGGNTPGNRKLIQIISTLSAWLKEEYRIDSADIRYNLWDGGIFLKDAAVLAGLGVIGRNNLLVTQFFGPRVRLRAMYINAELETSPRLEFDPCTNCEAPCLNSCPQAAFSEGTYARSACRIQMDFDMDNRTLTKEKNKQGQPREMVRFCRNCELACPASAVGW